MSDTAATPRRSRDSVRQSWAERLARFESSNLPVLDFCRQEGIASQSLYYWKRKLADPAAAPGPVPQFVPVRLCASAPVELVLPGGAVLRLQPGCDLAFVRSLLEALTVRPC
jgi:hypothetical protein